MRRLCTLQLFVREMHTKSPIHFHTCVLYSFHPSSHIYLCSVVVKATICKLTLWEIPGLSFKGRAGDAAGPDMHQSVDEHRDQRKEISILVTCPLSQCLLINVCKCYTYCIFPLFTRESFGSKPSLTAFSASLKTLRQLRCRCALHFCFSYIYIYR